MANRVSDMHEKVLQAVRDAYNVETDKVKDHLTEGENGRVFGLLVVDNALFHKDSIAIRSRKMWKSLRRL